VLGGPSLIETNYELVDLSLSFRRGHFDSIRGRGRCGLKPFLSSWKSAVPTQRGALPCPELGVYPEAGIRENEAKYLNFASWGFPEIPFCRGVYKKISMHIIAHPKL